MIKMFKMKIGYPVWTVTFAALTSVAVGFLDPVPCDEYYTGDSGILTHPNFPFNYTSGRRCLQRIYFPKFTSQNQKRICFNFRLFQLANSSGCFDDYLEFPGPTGMVKYCGNGTAGQEYGDNKILQNVFLPNFCWPLTSGTPFDLRFHTMDKSSNLGFYTDYVIREVELKPVAPVESCSVDQFSCFDQRCVAENHVCDLEANCDDASDEGYWFARCPGVQSIEACSFESDMCQFSGEGVVRNTTSYGGPRFDHTFLSIATGHFIYFDGSDLAYLNYSSTPVLRSGNHCLSFWYFMRGYVGSLTLYVTEARGTRLSVWYRSDDHGSNWLQAEVDIPAEAFPLQEIMFEANDGLMDVNNIAIDDISLLKGDCYRNDISCTFELGFCGWRHHTLSEMMWVRTYDPTLATATRPLVYSPNNLYKIHFDSSNCVEGNRARLVSRAVSYGFSGTSCLRFWYFRLPESHGILNVAIVDYGGAGQTVWSSINSKPQNGLWMEVRVSISTNNGPFQVVFEGKCVSRLSSDMSIDDIELTPGFCPSSPSRVRTEAPFVRPSTGHPSGCTWDEYKCEFSRQCINRILICNARNDCSDGSDEIGCPFTAIYHGLGGELLPNEDERVFFANDVVIGVSVVCVAIFLTAVISIIVAVRRRSILFRMGRVRAIRRQAQSIIDSSDPFPKPPPYDYSPPVAPSYSANPPPYATNFTGVDETDDDTPPPAYEMEPSFIDAVEMHERSALYAARGPRNNEAFAAPLAGPNSANGLRGFRTSSV